MIPSRVAFLFLSAFSAISILPGASARAAEQKSFTLTIKDHRFVPATLEVPAGEEFTLTVINADATSEEFESQDFHVEKVVAGGKQITVHVGPLTAGSYGFFGERHQDTALGNMFAQ